MTMEIFKIYPSASADSHVCTIMIEGGPEAAIEAVKSVGGVECFLESTAYAELVTE